MPNKPRAIVFDKVEEQRQISAEKISGGFAHWNLDREDRRLLQRILFHPNIAGPPVLANQSIRRLAIEAMIDTVRGAFRKNNRDDLYLLTFCLDEGMTRELRPVIDLVALGRKVYKALRRLDVTGIGVFEFDSFRPITGDGAQGHRIWTHAHVLARSRPGGLDWRAAMTSINALPSFSNCLDANPVDLRPITPAALDLTRVAAYLFEYRHVAKYRKRMPHGGFETVPVRTGFEPASALRLAEIESQIALSDLVFGVGQRGVELRRRWKVRFEELRAALSAPSASIGEIDNVAALWERIRAIPGNGSRRYHPCEITTRSGAYRRSRRPDGS